MIDYGFKTIGKVIDENLQHYKDVKEGKIDYFPTEWEGLNAKFKGGLHKRKTIVIGARPGMGKSAFSNKLIFGLLKLAIKAGKKVLVPYWSWEMSGSDQITRIGISDTQDDIEQNLSQENFERYTKAVTRYKDYPIYFCEKSQTSQVIYDVNGSIREKYPDHTIINLIDHSRYVLAPGRGEMEKLNELSSTLHKINVDYSSINILLSQLNRNIEKDGREKSFYKPLLTDLFGADSVGQDCDICLMLNRPYDVYGLEGDYEGYSTKGLLACHVVKNRGGAVGMVPFDFDAEHFTITERNGGPRPLRIKKQEHKQRIMYNSQNEIF